MMGGDFDCAVGWGTSGNVQYLINKGSRTSPNFAEIGAEGGTNPFGSLQAGDGPANLACFDMDGDQAGPPLPWPLTLCCAW
jgi:hypothetical protein